MMDRLNKIYDALNEKIQQKGFIIRYLFEQGLKAKQYQMELGLDSYHWFYDSFLFNRVLILIVVDCRFAQWLD